VNNQWLNLRVNDDNILFFSLPFQSEKGKKEACNWKKMEAARCKFYIALVMKK